MFGPKRERKPAAASRARATTRPRRAAGGLLRSRLPAGLRWACVLAALACVAWQASGLPRWLAGADAFRLTALEVGGLRVLTGREVLAASGLRLGDNLFAVDLRAVADRLERLPWVRNAAVRRRPPDRLVVDLLERRRVAWIDLDTILGIDAEGVLLPGHRRAAEAPADLDLPVITGLECPADSVRPGATLSDPPVRRLLGWWRSARAADAEFCMSISEIQPLDPHSVRLRLVGDGLEVRLPIDQPRARLRTLRELLGRIYRECPDPAYIDMRFAGQLVVGSRERRSS